MTATFIQAFAQGAAEAIEGAFCSEEESRGAEIPMYNAIYTVVDRDKAEDVMDSGGNAYIILI